jgi:adenine-specific DNA-methyltransferase
MINQIHNIDCLQGLKQIKDESVDLVVTSPPYNIGKPYEKKLDIYDYIQQQEKVIKECSRILKDTGSICWQVGYYVSHGAVYPLDSLLFNKFIRNWLIPRNRIIWTFGHGLHAKRRLSGRHEVVSWWTKTDDYIFNLDPIRVPQKYPNKKAYKGANKGKLSGNPLGKNPGDVWDITNVKANHGEKTAHPCQFPEALIERLVLALTNRGALVVDPFMGSGTTAVVCKRLGRDFIGFELVEDYIKICKDRLDGVEAPLQMREGE